MLEQNGHAVAFMTTLAFSSTRDAGAACSTRTSLQLSGLHDRAWSRGVQVLGPPIRFLRHSKAQRITNFRAERRRRCTVAELSSTTTLTVRPCSGLSSRGIDEVSDRAATSRTRESESAHQEPLQKCGHTRLVCDRQGRGLVAQNIPSVPSTIADAAPRSGAMEPRSRQIAWAESRVEPERGS